jgi:hypothetical protein
MVYLKYENFFGKILIKRYEFKSLRKKIAHLI